VNSPPGVIDGAIILLVADLENTASRGESRHVVREVEVGDFAALAIARYAGEAGVYLFYCDDEWRAITDTLHENVEGAVAQAEFEFGPVQFRRIGDEVRPGGTGTTAE
jgi:hypothetical protein